MDINVVVSLGIVAFIVIIALALVVVVLALRTHRADELADDAFEVGTDGYDIATLPADVSYRLRLRFRNRSDNGRGTNRGRIDIERAVPAGTPVAPPRAPRPRRRGRRRRATP